jgi:hypothetical protein
MTENIQTHPGTTTYLIVAACLTVLTAMEVTAFYVQALKPVLLACPLTPFSSEIRAGRHVLHALEIRPVGVQRYLLLSIVHRRPGGYLPQSVICYVFG